MRQTSSALRVLKKRLDHGVVEAVSLARHRDRDAVLSRSSAWYSTEQYWLPRTPFCLSSGDSGGVDFLATLRDEREDFSREVTLQRSNGVEFGMAFCDPTSNIILGSLIGP